MKTKKYYSVLSAAVILFILGSAFTFSNDGNGKNVNKDIIKFSHQFHLELTDCESCHSSVTEAATLNDRLLPTKDDCAACHDVEDDEMCTTCHYEDVYEPMIQSVGGIIFDHSFHTSDENTECQTCHKGLDQVDYSFEAENAIPGMETCYTCHNDISVASNACESCHIALAGLIPDDHKTAAFMDNHKFIATNDDENCVMCHDNSFCEACHVSTTMIDAPNTAEDFYAPYSPHSAMDNTKQQQLTRVHSIDYVYSHGIDAKGKTTECQTCHETESFCADCHNTSGGDYAASGFIPYSHTLQNFVTIGVGSGGGEHADLARRDIETCAACHDTYGADPSCILCHHDTDGIQNTNPKTHTTSFMHSEKGDWHEDMGSVCFNCHTDGNAYPSGTPGLGFCGYCHGS
ncbi:cytochrome c3 family protein [Bacteroidota bacterium]